jgi:hypothetical protein
MRCGFFLAATGAEVGSGSGAGSGSGVGSGAGSTIGVLGTSTTTSGFFLRGFRAFGFSPDPTESPNPEDFLFSFSILL